MVTGERPAGTARRSALATLALAATVISAVGMVILVAGDLAGASWAEEGEDGALIGDVSWLMFFFGGIGALVLGAVSAVVGSRRGNAATRQAGFIALGYCLLAAVIAIIFSTVT